MQQNVSCFRPMILLLVVVVCQCTVVKVFAPVRDGRSLQEDSHVIVGGSGQYHSSVAGVFWCAGVQTVVVLSDVREHRHTYCGYHQYIINIISTYLEMCSLKIQYD